MGKKAHKNKSEPARGEKVQISFDRDVSYFLDGEKSQSVLFEDIWVYLDRNTISGRCFVQPGGYGELYLYAKKSEYRNRRVVISGEACFVKDSRGQRRNTELISLLKAAEFEISPVFEGGSL